MSEIVGLISAVVAAIAGVIAILPLFGVDLRGVICVHGSEVILSVDLHSVAREEEKGNIGVGKQHPEFLQGFSIFLYDT